MLSAQLLERMFHIINSSRERQKGLACMAPELAYALQGEDGEFHRRMETLRNTMSFGRLSAETLGEAVRRMCSMKVTAGQVIVRQGDTQADAFYTIESGRAEVWQVGLYDDEPRLVAELHPGDTFGEAALVTGGARTATVKMVEDGELLTLSRKDFNAMVSKPLIREVEAHSVEVLRAKGYRLLDVRFEEEHEESRIPGAMLMPLNELRQRACELDPRASYIAYCHSGKRSAVAALLLSQRNIDAVSLAGGIRDWPFEKVWNS